MNKIFISCELLTLDYGCSAGLFRFVEETIKRNYILVCDNIPAYFQKLAVVEGMELHEGNESTCRESLQVQEGKIVDRQNQTYTSLYDLLSKSHLFNRIAELSRKTGETDIYAKVNLDGQGKSNIRTGIGFFDHMLDQISRHANIDLDITIDGDLHVDEHHTVEDTGIVLGEVIKEALGKKTGIKRYGFVLPMDDSTATVAIDFGGRPFLKFDCEFKREKVGEFPTELVEEFFRGFVNSAMVNFHITCEGRNDHHKIESIFKGFAKTLNEACRQDERVSGLPSTKGLL